MVLSKVQVQADVSKPRKQKDGRAGLRWHLGWRGAQEGLYTSEGGPEPGPMKAVRSLERGLSG